MKNFSPLTVCVATSSRYEINATAIACGEDWNITVCGGTKHHVGAVATAYWESQQLHIHSFALPSHQDHFIAKMFAERISSYFHSQTAVSAGIHIDNASKKEIAILIQNSQSCCDLLIQNLKKKADSINKVQK